MFHKITEHNSLKGTFHRVILLLRQPVDILATLDHALGLEKTHILQFLHQQLGHIAFTPTCGHIGDSFLFNLGFVLFGSHLKVTSLGSGATRGAFGI